MRGKFTTDLRSCIVDRALSRFGVEKLTGLAENRIGFAAQNAFTVVFSGESLGRFFYIEGEMSGDLLQISLCDLDSLIYRATVRGTFRTVVLV